jgi:hypothetical protein
MDTQHRIMPIVSEPDVQIAERHLTPSSAYHSTHIPHDAPFRLGVLSGKGWGAFATRRIPKGDKILQEKPLFVIRKPHWMIEERDIVAAYHSLTK